MAGCGGEASGFAGIWWRWEVGLVNQVVLVGEVTDRPFRPGGGTRAVVKMQVYNDESGRRDDVEFDAFGPVSEFAMGLWRGDRIAIRGRVEGRVFDEFEELKIVADHVELLRKASDVSTERASTDSG